MVSKPILKRFSACRLYKLQNQLGDEHQMVSRPDVRHSPALTKSAYQFMLCEFLLANTDRIKPSEFCVHWLTMFIMVQKPLCLVCHRIRLWNLRDLVSHPEKS